MKSQLINRSEELRRSERPISTSRHAQAYEVNMLQTKNWCRFCFEVVSRVFRAPDLRYSHKHKPVVWTYSSSGLWCPILGTRGDADNWATRYNSRNGTPCQFLRSVEKRDAMTLECRARWASPRNWLQCECQLRMRNTRARVSYTDSVLLYTVLLTVLPTVAPGGHRRPRQPTNKNRRCRSRWR
eukprot:8249654-Pyramimonas_sp.AAC.1